MSKGFESQEGTLNKDAVEWTSKVRKLLLGISDVKLNKVDTNVPHTAQKDLEDLTESRERTESRLRKKDELRTEEIEKQQKLLDKARKVEQLRHDAIRDGESTLTVGKAIKKYGINPDKTNPHHA